VKCPCCLSGICAAAASALEGLAICNNDQARSCFAVSSIVHVPAAGRCDLQSTAVLSMAWPIIVSTMGDRVTVTTTTLVCRGFILRDPDRVH